MASNLLVPVVRVENVRAHGNADALELCDVLGYQMAVPKGKYKTGDLGVYFPADTLLPAGWAEQFGVRSFLRGKEQDRVGKIRLRGEPSFGLIASIPEGVSWAVGDNVAEYFGCKKYEPPIRVNAGDAAPRNEKMDPFLERYTDIQNGRIYTEVFFAGEEVVATEKIHGTNVRLGIVRDVDIFAASMSVRRKRPEKRDVTGCPAEFDDSEMAANTYWFPWTLEPVRDLINSFCVGVNKAVVLCGEVFGGSIQSLDYGIPKGKGFGFRAFDISIDGKYLDWTEFERHCKQCGVPIVPVLYRGPYSFGKMKELADGNTMLEGASHMREGIVVKPIRERVDPKVGRAVVKIIGTEYDLSKHKEKDTTDI
jgi:RNA ligase (TIGR02306 family)